MNRTQTLPTISTPAPFWRRWFGGKTQILESREVVSRAWAMHFARFQSCLDAESIARTAQLAFYVQLSPATRVAMKRARHMKVGSHELAEAMLAWRAMGEAFDINSVVARHLYMDISMLIQGADELSLSRTTVRLLEKEQRFLAAIR